MANYSVAAGEVGVNDKTLVAATADTVSWASQPKYVELLWDGTAKGYVTTDGSTPGSNNHSLPLPASLCKRIIRMGDKPLKIIAPSGTPTYSVTVV